MVHALTYVSLIYAVALSGCDELFISSKNASRVFSAFLIGRTKEWKTRLMLTPSGSAFGGLVANSLSDRYGRRRYLTYSLICMFFSSFTAAFGYNTFVVIGASLFLGVGWKNQLHSPKSSPTIPWVYRLETCAVQIRLLLVEVLCPEKRGFWMALCNISWTFGYSLITCKSCWYLPRLLKDTFGQF